MKYFNETGDVKKTNELITFFNSNTRGNYGDFILSGRLDELNRILRS